MTSFAPNTEATTHRRILVAALLALTTIIALSLWIEVRRIPAVYDARRVLFGDPDDYMRLYRVRQIVSGGRYLIRDDPQMNYPHGTEPHWTTPVDFLFAVPVFTLKPFIRHPDQVAFVLAWIPPALGVFYLIVMFALVRSLATRMTLDIHADMTNGAGMALNYGAAGALYRALPVDSLAGLLAALMTALSPGFHRAFQMGHPDHQCALELLSLLAVFLALGGRAVRHAVLAGAAAGLSVWIAQQSLVVWLAIFVALTVGALQRDLARREIWINRRNAFSAGALALIVIGWLIENAPGRLARFHADKISLSHVLVFAAACLAPPYAARLLSQAQPDGPRQAMPIRIRLMRTGFLALILYMGLTLFRHGGEPALQYTSRPEFFRWMNVLMEFQPLIFRAGDSWSFANLHRSFGFAPYFLPLAMWFVVRARRLDPPTKVALALLSVGLTALSIYQRRWIEHANVGLIPVVVLGALGSAQTIGQRISRGSTPQIVLAATLCLIVFFPSMREVLRMPYLAPHPHILRAVAVADRIRQQETKRRAAVKAAVAPTLSTDANRAILAEEGDGPLLLDRTGLPVIAGPYHRSLDGILEVARFFCETDSVAARKTLVRLGIRYIVVPLRPGEQLMNFEQVLFGELRSFDPPDRSIDADGNLALKLHFKPRASQTMAYRLAMLDPPPELGLRLLLKSREGAPTPDGLSGLLYLVENTPAAEPDPAASREAAQPAAQRNEP